jgi:hypothetical protein
MNKIKEFMLIMGLGLVAILLIGGFMLLVFQTIMYFGLEVFPVMFGGLVLLSAFLLGKIMLKAYRDEE